MMTGGFENSGVKIFSPGRGVRHVGHGDRNDLFGLRRERAIGKNSRDARACSAENECGASYSSKLVAPALKSV